MNYAELLKTIASTGGWIIAALFFMGQMSGYIDSPILSTRIKVEQISQSLADHRARQEILLERLTLALRIMCENSARTVSEANNCKNIQ